jgi:hypothetical protein
MYSLVAGGAAIAALQELPKKKRPFPGLAKITSKPRMEMIPILRNQLRTKVASQWTEDDLTGAGATLRELMDRMGPPSDP